ncbi:MAG: hypothetical protein IT530_14130 [Burkholderiales bacterium]|nr:hypothetical protein [Burkholderiales bacterium]
MGALLDLATKAEPASANTQPDVPEALPDAMAEARRQRVLAMLAERPAVRYAVLTETEADPDAVILALAVRGAMPDGGIVSCELLIPRGKYDPRLLFDLIGRHSATMH